MLRDLASSTHILSPTALESAEMWEEEEPYGEESFINISLLSHLAVQLRDSVKRATHVKGSIPYPNAFTGKDIVVCRSSANPNPEIRNEDILILI